MLAPATRTQTFARVFIHLRGGYLNKTLTIVTEQLINNISKHYTQTSKSTSAVYYILNALNANVGGDVTPVLQEEIKRHQSRKVVQDVGSICNALSGFLEDQKESTAFRELAGFAAEHAKTLPVTVEDLKLPTDAEVKRFIEDLDSSLSQAIATLIWNGGFRLSDLARDAYKLSKVGEGLVQVSGAYGNTRAREVTSENSFGLSPEMVQELLPLLQDKLISADSLGLDVAKTFSPYTTGWRFTPTQLRTGHAEKLLNGGMSYAEVSDVHGIRPDTLRERQRKYRKAN